MQYELTTSKSSSAIVPTRNNNSAHHLIDCFRRFAGKSKSKKRLFNFGFKNDDPVLAIDHEEKSKRFGSTPNVHALRAEFLNFSPPVETNQSGNCVGLPNGHYRPRHISDYDNMNGMANNPIDAAIRKPLITKRSRKAVSEIGCPITVLEVGNSHKLPDQYPKNHINWRAINRNSFVDSNRLYRRSHLFERSGQPTSERRFSNFSSGATTGAHQSIQSPLSANVSRPSLDFGAFSRSDGSTSIDSNGIRSDEKHRATNNVVASTQFPHHESESRSSSLTGQIHCDLEDHNFGVSAFDRYSDRITCENGLFNGQTHQHYGLENRLKELQKSNDQLCRENLNMNQKIQEQQQIIANLKTQLNNERKLFADEKQALLVEHQMELKNKDTEMIQKEISVFQRLSLNTPSSENKFSCATSDTDSTKLDNRMINSPINRLTNSTHRPQSLYMTNTPNRPLSSHDLVAKDRHRNLFNNSNTQLHLSRSSSTTPDSGAVIPLSLSPNLIPLFREMVTCVFHLHNSSDNAAQFTGNWLKHVRPQICSPHMRVAFADLLSKLEQMQHEDIEHVLEHTIKLLHNSIDTLFGLKRDLVELYKKEVYKIEDAKKDEGYVPNE